MTQEQKTLLLGNLKSFGWKLLCYAAVAILAFAADQIKLFSTSPLLVTIVGLLVGQGTEWFNTHQGLMGKTFLGKTKV